MGWGEETRPAPLEVPNLEVLGPVSPGCVLVLRDPSVSSSRERQFQMKRVLARQIGHDQFGLAFVGGDESTVELLRPADLAEIGWVYVGSPGVCPACGSDQVVVQTGEKLARSCSGCGHRWSQFHPGAAA